MSKKTLFLLGLAFVALAVVIKLLLFSQKVSLLSPISQQQTKANVNPSTTLKEYTDPSGFSFNYPDNLSLLNNELKEDSSYADLQLTSKDVEGSVHLQISDSNFKSLDEWVKSTAAKESPKEASLGNLKALEIKNSDKLLMGALDQGVLFSIEANFAGNEEFWSSIYSSVLQDFSFAPPPTASSGAGSYEDISYEGEEVVE